MRHLGRAVCSLSIVTLLVVPGQAQTNVDSFFTGTISEKYDDPRNWSPAEVPNNTETRSYNVTVPHRVEVNTRARVSNLTANGLVIGSDNSLTVADAAAIGAIAEPDPNGYDRSGLSLINGGIFSVEGALTNFDVATRTLTGGEFSISRFPQSGSGATLLRFRAADIVRNASFITLSGPMTRIVDEVDRDALRNFAHNSPIGKFRLADREFTTSGSFTNDGLLEIWNGTFTVTGSLTNFDAVSRRLSGGVYEISGGVSGGGTMSGLLRFPGADIVRNAASLTIDYGGSVADEHGNDGLRNLAHNEAGALFNLIGDFTAAGDFRNEGSVLLLSARGPGGGQFAMTGSHRYLQTAGETDIQSGTFTGMMQIDGGELSATSSFFAGPARLIGSLVVDDALLSLGQLAVTGSVQLGASSRFRVARGEHGLWQLPAALAVDGPVTLAGLLEIEDPGDFPAASSFVFAAIRSSGRTGTFQNAPHGSRLATTNGRGSFIVSYQGNDVLIGGYQRTPRAAQLLNISTRAQVGSGERVAIAGFIVSGTEPKRVIVRGLGPSLVLAGSPPTLSDPTLALHDSRGVLITTNDNWQDSQEQEIRTSGVPPEHPSESAIVATLPRGAYTVILRDKNTSSAAQGLVEVYDLAPEGSSKLGNISTRGHVDAGNVLIGGVIAGGRGEGSAELVVRAIGPGLAPAGVQNPLPDPTLEIRDRNGGLVRENDDFVSPAETAATIPPGLHPLHPKDAATGVVLPPGEYTAIVRGKNNESGVALVEVFDLNL
ncbi:hypothetical protein BH20VER1_BH20VER1_30920 [soil metagenome]